ncbi:MAG: methylenetetrahydrofolate--tRNA-(uracil(54)-C(5))-methyltransferase (FADH(2)-oxidizing) TrmFO [Veillonella sp.]|uniref:methylenetetrahydrofolate--tRNA-(uracil(54)- C(5))-methyltransferase (FADH(2)-oxidizing) TrmFO n=1 Tax=Veillonella sp. TaxID=1926307 RepID=UPI001B54005D|nr:methylenetetrahydrofolate--tRNA-(uracil(54)-C(5))-methyltransferase (FADH(2)-oxidizing) TrmFO [Veillonella sp.]MBK7921222.1 methylenetetrahydrofolate--tRNA-(uracil(54)-C(5))-methyltransferase (FADH(2)-oxidizing) TrmFO [Veillonella sp.]MBP6922586.1 methylenetetrahydrofolate--tRNA-(uracil(54)-C(5))-methyltransferase (FADH(2)-oxidizing) TrmFO [Veillonella sp.]MBP8616303.1 methylenetetrahydrofolate--tRNA-(uracil(54)-C(5))-methyltransferase (FADH(2)-oxidizing) TrmFO [Veillonella sp.]MBP9550432.1 
MKTNKVTVIGAGLAGSEAAWQLAKQGIQVDLYEMRPVKTSPAHQTEQFAELVCSNSLRAGNIENAVGLLKEEMRRLGSLIMECADATAVPAGGALAVDRNLFSEMVTKKVSENPLITVHREEVTDIPQDGVVVIATGPLTSETLGNKIRELTGETSFYFYDAAAPIVTAESLNYDKVFAASRYDKGDADYLNCPMTEEEYKHFWHELTTAEAVQPKDFEKEIYFEGCMPVEIMASRGEDTLRYGPLKPVGLVDKRTNEESYAVVQLRKENKEATMYNLVGFQTHLKWGEQKRVFGLIPGLENADFIRYGVMHRNTYINSPELLNHAFQLKQDGRLFFAGQMTGVEGYLESAASGLMVGLQVGRLCEERQFIEFPKTTAVGALSQYISNYEGSNFQPMNVNFGIMDPWPQRIRKKKEKNGLIAQRALEELHALQEKEGLV